MHLSLRGSNPTSVELVRSWVAGIGRVPTRQALIRGLDGSIDQREPTAVAEGDEPETERTRLAELGVPRGQGDLSARPAPAATFAVAA